MLNTNSVNTIIRNVKCMRTQSRTHLSRINRLNAAVFYFTDVGDYVSVAPNHRSLDEGVNLAYDIEEWNLDYMILS